MSTGTGTGNGNGNGHAMTINPSVRDRVALLAPDHHLAESTAVVRERTFDREMDIAYLVGLLRNQRVTGTIRIDMSQGGVCAIRLEERQKL